MSQAGLYRYGVFPATISTRNQMFGEGQPVMVEVARETEQQLLRILRTWSLGIRRRGGYVSCLARKISISLTTTQRLATCGEPIGALPLGDRGGVIHSNRCAGSTMRSPNVALDAYVRGLDEPIPEQLTLAVRRPVDVLLARQCSPMIKEVTWQQQRITTRLGLVG